MNGVIVLLNGDRGLATLQAVSGAGHEVLCAVVPKGNAIADAVRRSLPGVEIVEVQDANGASFVAELAVRQPEVLVVAGFSTILRQPVLGVARLGAINLHAGRLPQYRGGSPLNWQLLNREPFATCSVLKVDEGIDTGDVLTSTDLAIGPDDTIADLHERANVAFPAMVLDVLARYERGDTAGEEQDERLAGYWHQRNDADGHINWARMTADEVHAFVRALTTPYPGAFGFVEETKVRILATAIPDLRVHGTPGRVCFVQRNGPFVVCADRAVLVADARFEGGRVNRLRTGMRLR